MRELAAQPTKPRLAIEDLADGRFCTTAHGRCFAAETSYALDHVHGDLPLNTCLTLDPDVIAQIAGDDTLRNSTLGHTCFIDTETTGLSTGTGTMAFVVGIGFFTHESFVVRQYFLRDPGDEPAMVETLADDLSRFEALVSFNGRTFDIPIIENRFILARIPPRISQIPHLDLLHPARRLWRYSLTSCSLGTLERESLGIVREQADVPGGVIPLLYRDFLRTGDAREMKRVLYHNEIDILSLVTLTVHLARAYADPWTDTTLSGAEFFGLARWYAAERRLDDAERAYTTALEHKLSPELREKTLGRLALLLKQADRRDEAFAYWQQLASESSSSTEGHIEMAKHLEWHTANLPLAAEWTRTALSQASNWPQGMLRDLEIETLEHRLRRLERKMRRNPPD
ncbi:MAG: ribonuclease H-like domain-containing protein [Anaerolineae bacterium]|nr:ribonuclease H-like domain-containing protein [Anaerolineae bacterium]